MHAIGQRRALQLDDALIALRIGSLVHRKSKIAGTKQTLHGTYRLTFTD